MNPPVMSLAAGSASLLPLSVGIVRYKKLSTAMKVFLLFCLLTCLEIVAEFILSYRGINNLFLGNSSFPVETAFIAAVYAFALEGKKVRGVIITLGGIFLFIWTVDKIFFDLPGSINEEMAILSRIFIIVLSVIALHTTARRTMLALTDEPLFWLTSGNLLYSAGIVLLLGLSNEIAAMGVSYFIAAWNINWSLDIIANVMFAKGFLCKVTPRT
ncbi:MAG TPA: hypothetical protein VMM58_13565 [Bacteroidota bacterium]|nr:hypothetical protein [Bacteroidota bacterium]